MKRFKRKLSILMIMTMIVTLFPSVGYETAKAAEDNTVYLDENNWGDEVTIYPDQNVVINCEWYDNTEVGNKTDRYKGYLYAWDIGYRDEEDEYTEYASYTNATGKTIELNNLTKSCIIRFYYWDKDCGRYFYDEYYINVSTIKAKKQSYNYEIGYGKDITLSVEDLIQLYKGTTIKSYQWEKMGKIEDDGDYFWDYVAIDNANMSSYTIKDIKNDEDLRCVVTDSNNNCVEIYFYLQPVINITPGEYQSLAVAPGDSIDITAEFETDADLNDVDISYQWCAIYYPNTPEDENVNFEPQPIDGATDKTITINGDSKYKLISLYCTITVNTKDNSMFNSCSYNTWININNFGLYVVTNPNPYYFLENNGQKLSATVHFKNVNKVKVQWIKDNNFEIPVYEENKTVTTDTKEVTFEYTANTPGNYLCFVTVWDKDDNINNESSQTFNVMQPETVTSNISVEEQPSNEYKSFKFIPEKSGIYLFHVKKKTDYTESIDEKILDEKLDTLECESYEYDDNGVDYKKGYVLKEGKTYYILTSSYAWDEENQTNLTSDYDIEISYSREYENTDPSHVHDLEVKSKKDATCVTPEITTYECKECGKIIEKETGKALGHKETVIPAVAATCENAGKTAGTKCTVCNQIIKAQTTVPATGHKWDSGKVTKEATTTDTGIKTYTCIACKKTKTEVIPKTTTVSDSEKPDVPAEGTKIEDSKAEYKVADSEEKEVSYTTVTNKKAKTVTIPDTVTIDGVTYNVTKVDNGAFKNNKKVTKVTVGKNVTEIGKEAFKGATKLKSVTVDKNVEKIGANAFDGCKSLKTITIKSKKLTSKNISKKAFKGLKKGTTIKVPKKKLKEYKKLFKKKGLSSKVKVKGY